MKILSVNAGSSSLKFTGFEMPEEKVLISGVFERIGIENSFYTIKINGEKIKKEVDLPNHTVAFKLLIQELIDNNIVETTLKTDTIVEEMFNPIEMKTIADSKEKNTTKADIDNKENNIAKIDNEPKVKNSKVSLFSSKKNIFK